MFLNRIKRINKIPRYGLAKKKREMEVTNGNTKIIINGMFSEHNTLRTTMHLTGSSKQEKREKKGKLSHRS